MDGSTIQPPCRNYKIELEAIRASLQEQIGAIHDASKAAVESKNDPLPIPLPVVVELQVPEADKTEQRAQSKKSYALQMWLAVGTWLAFGAAAIYAAIAAKQLTIMNFTYGEIEKQTRASQDSAYASCLNAQAAQTTLTQIQNSVSDSHAMTVATVQQAAASIEAERANLTFNGSLPSAVRPISGNLEVPFMIANDGKSAAHTVTVRGTAILLRKTDVLNLRTRQEEIFSAQRIPAESQAPGTSKDPRFKGGFTFPITVRDVNGAIVLYSPQTLSTLDGQNAMIALIAHFEYSDFAGTHKVRLCGPLFVASVGTSHAMTTNEKMCAKYNQQNDQYAGIPTSMPSTPTGIARLEPVNCVNPNR